MRQELIDDITRFLYVERKPVPSEMIFVPGGPWAELPEKAAELYALGFGKTILCSGRFAFRHDSFTGVFSGRERYGNDFPTEAAFYRQVLLANGVPDEAILLEDESRYTRQNAELSAALCARLGLKPKTGILVCHGFHARRSLVFYQHHFPDCDFTLAEATAEGLGFNKANWFKREKGIKLVLSELQKCGEQFPEEISEALFRKEEGQTARS